MKEENRIRIEILQECGLPAPEKIIIRPGGIVYLDVLNELIEKLKENGEQIGEDILCG
jgi:hypothetical protein